MSAKYLVLAIFADEPTADRAAASLQETAIAANDAMGILVLDEAGQLQIDKVGARS